MRATSHNPHDKLPATGGAVPKAILPDEGYVRIRALASPNGVTGISKSTIWDMARKGRFPAPVKLSPQVTAWRVEDVRAWLADPADWQAVHGAKAGA